MGRKKKGDKAIESRIQKYLEVYELDDMNEADDLASLREVCSWEIRAEKIHKACEEMENVGHDVTEPKKYEALVRSAKEATNARNNLLDSLGIAKKKRISDSEETPLSYIERLKTRAKEMLDKRFEEVVCPGCNLGIMKYCVRIKEKGDDGALAYEGSKLKKIKYSILIECPHCEKDVRVNERT